MKKKIINGILMVALVAATSTSFVSCKDTSEDVKTDLMAQVNAVKANLEPRVEQAEKDIDALEGRMTTAESDIATLKQDVADIKEDIAELDTRVGDLEEATEDLQKRMNTVEERIGTIVDALRNMVTSVTVNATSTSILQNSKLFPGLDMQFLGAAYGQAEGNGKFPSTTTLKGHGTALDASDFEAADQIEWSKNDFLPLAEEGKAPAGTVYFTVNPSNIDIANLKGLALQNSQNEESFVTIDKEAAKASDATLTWGITRADGDTFAPTLWEAPAIINLKDKDLATIDPTEIIDFKAVASDVRSMLSEVKTAAEDANRSNYSELAKTTAKNVLKNSAQIVASLLSAKVPTMPALALAAQWEDTVGVRSVLSDYSIAATAYKPLGFGFGADLVDGRTVSFDKIDNVFARIVNKVVAKFPDVTTYKFNGTIAFDRTHSVLTYTISAGDFGVGTPAADYNVTIDLNSTFDDMETSINALGINNVNNMLDEIAALIADAKSYADRSKSFEVRVSDFLERELNRVITKVATDGLTRVLEPIILFQAGDNFNVTRFVEGETIPAGKITLVPTTMTYEVLAPAYKKYVAIKNNTTGKFAFKKVLTKGDADFTKVTIDNLAAGNYTVIYSALDFSGVQISKKYNVTVK